MMMVIMAMVMIVIMVMVMIAADESTRPQNRFFFIRCLRAGDGTPG